ncbi:MAG: ornithine--oxo-acid transaminase [Gemmatimonadetes bacterium]|nr:ornithine--oxo-acid transaminase [Gemmatimonadota bacterium]
MSAAELIELEDRHGAHNYHPLDIVVRNAEGAWVEDVDGKRYLDCLAAYSALNQGHRHPAILQTMIEQAHRVTLTSRAFRNEQLPLFVRDVAELTGMETVLPMNSGAEAVETAIKAARKWGYQVKGIEAGKAEIIACENNFHGRTTTVISFSSEAQYREGFAPFTPGFRLIPFGDAAALREAISPHTCAFLLEPIQAEAGILIPPSGYLAEVADICRAQDVLLVADEIQTGLGRTGTMFAVDHEDVKPDVMTLGKALSGGFYPVSAVVSRADVLGVFKPGDHGSTFGGNPLGCAVARTALRVLREEGLVERSAQLGAHLMESLREIDSPKVKEVRGRGLLVGIELYEAARPYCEALKEEGVLCKETHDRVIRMAPPLIVERSELDWAVERVARVLA